MAATHVVAVMMARGRTFCKIQAISLLASAGGTNVAVRPDAQVPSTAVAKGRPLGS